MTIIIKKMIHTIMAARAPTIVGECRLTGVPPMLSMKPPRCCHAGDTLMSAGISSCKCRSAACISVSS